MSRLIDVDFTLRRVFGKSSFRPFQREIITAALNGEDVFVQAATSFGKSLCFQLPAVIDHGITIVVSPLLALMNNQVAALKAAGIPVATINSNTDLADRGAILDDLRCGHPRTRLLYVTPEFCLTEPFRRNLTTVYEQGELARIAIDEAHCISEWGHDFRPAYSHLSHFRATYPSVPIIALTATATRAVQQDIIASLSLNPATLRSFTTSTSRPNLHFSVLFTSDANDTRFSSFVAWLRAIHARRATDPARSQALKAARRRPDAVSGIIYTPYRAECEKLASLLRAAHIGAAPYHAGLPASERAACQRRWLANEPGFDVIVATTAFGMGIDKEDVRFVVHWCMPKSFEAFYQEAGRAGRDGRAAACVVYYSREDRDRTGRRLSPDGESRTNVGAGSGRGNRRNKSVEAQLQARMKSFQKLYEYCERVDRCRHRLISEYFGEADPPVCNLACDWCKDTKALRARKEEGLASEEWVSTQREREGFYGDEYD